MSDTDLTITIKIDMIPASLEPADLAAAGEEMALEAMGDGPDHPSREAWIRAGLAASLLIRATRRPGVISADGLVAIIAGNIDPGHDESTPQRKAIVDGYSSRAKEFADRILERESARGVTS